MRICLAYHYVFNLTVETGESELAFDRFWRTYHEHDPGYPHTLILNPHNSPGRDIAAHQAIAPYLNCDFAVFMCARVFFWKPDWLARLVDSWVKHGPGLYGVMTSNEACPLTPDKKPNPHLRTCLFACWPGSLMVLRNKVESTNDGFLFESGEGSITNMMDQRTFFVDWDNSYSRAHWGKTTNGFRSGDQSNLLVKDRHSHAYDIANPEQKAMLERIANGE